MNRADQVRQALIWEAAAKRAYARAAQWKARLAADARAEFEEQGTAPTWRLPDLASVWLPVSHETVHVADPEAFAKWVQATHPGEVETVVQVRPAFQTATVQAARVDGEQVLDAEGTVIPGLAVKAGGEPLALQMRATDGAKPVLAEAAETVLANVAAALHLPPVPDEDGADDAA
jgi:hypothetical protein